METAAPVETLEKQTTFFHRFHSGWKHRPKASSFPQFPQPLRLVQIYRNKKTANPKTRNRLPRVFDISDATLSASAPVGLKPSLRAGTESQSRGRKTQAFS